MARIRTVKPDFFRHEGLQDLELAKPGSYVMLTFAGLWCVADREGRFEWRPRKIKLDVLPFLSFDIEETLNLLVEAQLIEKYVHDGQIYGAITSWDRHQIVSRDEQPSEIPAPNGEKTPYFRPLNQTQRVKVYERDKWICVYCGRDMKSDKRAACLDHIIPYSKGGTNREANLATSCKRCNAQKSDRTPLDAGLHWPEGLGEYLDRVSNTVHQCSVTPPLIGGSTPPDKEQEQEQEQGRERKGKEISPEALRLSGVLSDLILENNPGNIQLSESKKEATVTRWAADIEKINRIDKQTWQQIEFVIRWCQANSFWKANILSGSTLREQYDKLVAKIKAEKETPVVKERVREFVL